MFQITHEEIGLVKSQIATSPTNNFFEGNDGGRRKLPYAFSEQGIYMLATVLRGQLAEQQSIFIMRAFREIQYISIQEMIQMYDKYHEMDILHFVERVDEISHCVRTESRLKRYRTLVGISHIQDSINI